MAQVLEGLREALFMFWETLWALALGFSLSGIVQAFVSRGAMERTLGKRDLASALRASFFGMVSSSCSYAATAMAKSLIKKGAHPTNAFIFMFASTNLVIDLGIVIWVLLGWQFFVAEIVGGILMIALLSQFSRLLPKPDLGVASDHQHDAGHGEVSARTNWIKAARYTFADIGMLKRELVVGYIVAGLIAVLVPIEVWNTVFIKGGGWVSAVENALVAPGLAMVSFVCSIGNVPLAAALWKGGISFGGVVAFIFADLLTFPLVLIYKKYYGWRFTLRMVAIFWLIMSTAGLLVDIVFNGLHLVPSRVVVIAPEQLTLNSTTMLNLVALVGLAVLFWLRRQPLEDAAIATDPICGMQVEKSTAAATLSVGGSTYYFCSEGCRDRFQKQNQQHGR